MIPSMPPYPHVVFVPGGGSCGAGESVRSFVLADAIQKRWPASRVGFITDEQHFRLPYDAFERHSVSGRVSRRVPEVIRLLRELDPDVVVFDSRGVGSQISCASRIGARTVYIAAQPRTLGRIIRWWRLRNLDELWVVNRYAPPGSGLTPGQRILLRVAGTEVRFLDTIFPLPDSQRFEALRHKLGISDAPYVLFAPGGGGHRQGSRPVPEIFAEAAQRFSRTSSMPCVAVMGPLYHGPVKSAAGITVVDALVPTEMVDLVNGARLSVCGGGGLTGQALALGKLCVAVPAGGTDQPEHIRLWARAGLVEDAPLDPEAMADRARCLLDDPTWQAAILDRLRRSSWGNGLPESLQRLERLIADAPRGVIAP